ncbi:MAG: hypothetical protein MAG551_01521 [Candidatus Scalindua arabica]|uniref:Uncharacterized protein n=1 Tax=Candidatus Scalindua arabica TaxID=1127984 RepID=A0A941W2W6_9BACT|nr:hypothetical protein [Candidatus Scalindua arabica]
MNFDTQIITKCTLGFFMGISAGLLFRYFLFRILLFAAIPIVALLVLDYTNMFSIDWFFLNDKWDKAIVFLTPTAINIYSYLSNHILIGLIPGILIGLTSGFFFMRR